MSERLSLSLVAAEHEWDVLLDPFSRKGANDPVIAEIRESLRSFTPAWVAEKNVRDNQLTVERIEELRSAAGRRREFLDRFPDGKARTHALEQVAATIALTDELLTELASSPTAAAGATSNY